LITFYKLFEIMFIRNLIFILFGEQTIFLFFWNSTFTKLSFTFLHLLCFCFLYRKLRNLGFHFYLIIYFFLIFSYILWNIISVDWIIRTLILFTLFNNLIWIKFPFLLYWKLIFSFLIQIHQRIIHWYRFWCKTIFWILIIWSISVFIKIRIVILVRTKHSSIYLDIMR